jgi:hypothetical protein
MHKIHYNYAILAFGPNDDFLESRDDFKDAKKTASKRAKNPVVTNVALADLRKAILEMIKGEDIKAARKKLRMIVGINCKEGKIKKP